MHRCNAEQFERPVSRHEYEPFTQRLRRQHSVKWVGVMRRKSGSMFRVIESNVQLPHPALCELRENACGIEAKPPQRPIADRTRAG